jgi:hypothetical protein
MLFPKPYPPIPIDYEDWNILIDVIEARFGPSAVSFISDQTHARRRHTGDNGRAA